MKIFDTKQFVCKINEANALAVTRAEVDSFFEMLEDRSHGNTTVDLTFVRDADDKIPANVYDDGRKVVNPMLGRLFSITEYRFDYVASYIESQRRENPDYAHNRKDRVRNIKIKGFHMVEQTNTGKLLLRMVDFKVISVRYVMQNEDGTFTELTKDEWKSFLTPSNAKNADAPEPKIKKLSISKIYEMKKETKHWINRHSFLYPDVVSVL